MCLISCFPKGTSKKVKDVKGFIEKGMRTNTDGSGLMWKINGHKTVNFQKGFRKPEEVFELLEKLNLKDEDEAVFHSRIGTSGEKNDLNMHPFPVTTNKELLMKTSGRMNVPVMAHNGVFYFYTNYGSPYSDTWHFTNEFMGIPEFLALFKRDKDLFLKFFGSDKIRGNKLAFLFPDMDLVTVGDFTEDNGYLHSNGGYKEYVYNVGGVNRTPVWKQTSNGLTRDLRDRSILIGDNHEDDYAVSSEFPDDEDDSYIENQFSEGYDMLKGFKKFNSASAKMRASNQIFHPNELEITDDNYACFYFCPSKDTDQLTKGVGYEIAATGTEGLEGKVWMNEINSTKSILASLPDLLKVATIYVKLEFSSRYRGLYKLMKHMDGQPTRSMLKKLNKHLMKKSKKLTFNHEEFGDLYISDIKPFINRFKDSPTDLTINKDLIKNLFTDVDFEDLKESTSAELVATENGSTSDLEVAINKN